MEHRFTTYVRTKTLFLHRLKDLNRYDHVKIYLYELQKFGVNNGPVLFSLKERGEIAYDRNGYFRALKEGPIEPSLLEYTKKTPSAKLNSLHIWMRSQLLHITLKGADIDDIPVYFKAFLTHRDRGLQPFFSVDAFAGRVHTPIVNLKSTLRSKLRFYDERVVSLDVKQMQPLILAKVLLDVIGDNPFSDTLMRGEDVYLLLQRGADLPTRADAKKMLFRLIFGKPSNEIARMFAGDSHWIHWINQYKSTTEPKNPHSDKTHTNLAWLLQFSEVQVMTGIWVNLMKIHIPFLTIHDDILCRSRDERVVKRIMDNELKKHFHRYEIVVTR